MATTDMLHNFSAVLASDASTTNDITLNPDQYYELTHTGLKADGTAQTDEIWITLDGTTPSAVLGLHRAWLISGQDLIVGPGVSQIKYLSSGAAPIFNITAGPGFGRMY